MGDLEIFEYVVVHRLAPLFAKVPEILRQFEYNRPYFDGFGT